ncbi:MAG: hypothetical protein QXZ55_05310 [Pyrobaculum sp.]
MHKAFAVVALFKFYIAVVVFLTTFSLDPVLLVSCILMAISALIIRTIQEGEVAIVLVGLILLIDIIGLLLSFTQFSLIPIIAYIFLVVWDVQILALFRQMM